MFVYFATKAKFRVVRRNFAKIVLNSNLREYFAKIIKCFRMHLILSYTFFCKNTYGRENLMSSIHFHNNGPFASHIADMFVASIVQCSTTVDTPWIPGLKPPNVWHVFD